MLICSHYIGSGVGITRPTFAAVWDGVATSLMMEKRRLSVLVGLHLIGCENVVVSYFYNVPLEEGTLSETMVRAFFKHFATALYTASALWWSLSP